jgi:hypothetical protein
MLLKLEVLQLRKKPLAQLWGRPGPPQACNNNQQLAMNCFAAKHICCMFSVKVLLLDLHAALRTAQQSL